MLHQSNILSPKNAKKKRQNIVADSLRFFCSPPPLSVRPSVCLPVLQDKKAGRHRDAQHPGVHHA